MNDINNSMENTNDFLPSQPMNPNDLREDIVSHFISLGKDNFNYYKNNNSYTIEKYNILHWLFLNSQELNIPISILELNKIVDTVYAYVTNVYLQPESLQVGALKKALEGIPDNAPVLYQRIEDQYFNTGGWKTLPFQWENLHPVNDSKLQWLKDNPSPDYEIVEKEGVFYMREISHYIPAFSAQKILNDKGEISFIINAHY